MMSYHVILITNIPTPYRLPLFNELNKQLAHQGMGFKVIFGSIGYDRRKWSIDMADCGFEYEVLPSRGVRFRNSEGIAFTYPGVCKVISGEKTGAIITNGFSIATLKLYIRSWFKRTPYIIWSGAIEPRNHFDHFPRLLLRKMLVRRAAGFIAYGAKARLYLMKIGAPEDRIAIGINTVDVEFFRHETARFGRRVEAGKAEKHILYMGHLSPRKNVIKALKVFERLLSYRYHIIMDIVGDGEDRPNLEQYVRENMLTEHVHFHGFKQKWEIPRYLQRANCFLFQTDYDIWGLVLVEAMAAGVPCLASKHAGAAEDLVKDGVTGFFVDFDDTEAVTEKVKSILDDPTLAKSMGECAQELIFDRFTIAHSAKGFVEAVLKVRERQMA